jgi:SAM-dependent methyltransferase
VDVGCGTGALSSNILELANPIEVLGIDPSAAYVAYARGQITDPRWSFRIADADHLPDNISDIDAVVSGLALNFMPDPARALAQMKKLIRPGGTVAAYVWDYAEGMQFMRYFWSAAADIDPRGQELDEGSRFPICRLDNLRSLFQSELSDVELTDITIPTPFESFDAFWSPFLGGQGAAPGYVTSLQQNDVSLLRERLRSNLPTEPDGSIQLTARVWAVKGRR